MQGKGMARTIASRFAGRLGRAFGRLGQMVRPRDRQGFVTDLYAGVLGRPPEENELQPDLKRLSLFPGFADAHRLLSRFVHSEEAQQRLELEGRLWRRADRRMDSGPPVRAVLSLGTHCLTGMMLRKLDLKRFSGPFDWIFSSPDMVAHCIEDDFRTLLDASEHERIPPEKRLTPGANFCEHRFYRDRFGVKLMFNHHDVTEPEHRTYLIRCVERFRTAIRAEQRTLLVMVTEQHRMDQAAFDRLCAAVEPFASAELLVVRVGQHDHRVGSELIAQRGRNQLHDLHIAGEFGSLGFTSGVDHALFRHLLNGYCFDLPPAPPS